jgi:hypothetical protein
LHKGQGWQGETLIVIKVLSFDDNQTAFVFFFVRRMRYLDASFRARSAFAAAHRLPDESSVFGFTLDASDESAPVPLLVAGARAEAAGAAEEEADVELVLPVSVPLVFTVLVPSP